MLMKECKKCGSKNLYLEPRIKGQDILTADMVALKCKSCGKWLKWCPKNERVNYLKIEEPDKWQKLKEWLEEMIKAYQPTYDEWMALNYDFYNKTKKQSVYKNILDKMQELSEEE